MKSRVSFKCEDNGVDAPEGLVRAWGGSGRGSSRWPGQERFFLPEGAHCGRTQLGLGWPWGRVYV